MKISVHFTFFLYLFTCCLVLTAFVNTDNIKALVLFIEIMNVSAGETDGRKMEELEKLIWDPECKLSDKNIDQFLVIARLVFTLLQINFINSRGDNYRHMSLIFLSYFDFYMVLSSF